MFDWTKVIKIPGYVTDKQSKNHKFILSRGRLTIEKCVIQAEKERFFAITTVTRVMCVLIIIE